MPRYVGYFVFFNANCHTCTTRGQMDDVVSQVNGPLDAS